MIIATMGNTAPGYIKTHDATCIPECPARREVVTGFTPVLDENGDPVLNEETQEEVLEPIVEEVHDGAKTWIAVELGPDEQWRVTSHEIALDADRDDLAEWLDRAMMTITGDGTWNEVSTAPPAWVSCPDWPDLERRLAAHYDCPVGVPVEEEQP